MERSGQPPKPPQETPTPKGVRQPLAVAATLDVTLRSGVWLARDSVCDSKTWFVGWFESTNRPGSVGRT